MTENTSTVTLAADDAAARAVVTMVNGQITREAKVYPAYIKAHGVTRETVAEHVKALKALAYPGIKSDGRADRKSREYRAHTFGAKVRNGLNRALGADESDDTPKPAVLRVSLSGEGGGSSVVDMETELGQQILAFLAAEKSGK